MGGGDRDGMREARGRKRVDSAEIKNRVNDKLSKRTRMTGSGNKRGVRNQNRPYGAPRRSLGLVWET